MALWIHTHLKLPNLHEIELGEDFVGVIQRHGGGMSWTSVLLKPASSDEAVRYAIALRKAAQRLEEIGKGLA